MGMHVLFVMGRGSCDWSPHDMSIVKEKATQPIMYSVRPDWTGGGRRGVPGHDEAKGNQTTRPGDDGHLDMTERVHSSSDLFVNLFFAYR